MSTKQRVLVVLHARRFDEVIVSVLPHGISKWLALGLPARLRRTHELPIHQVTAHPRQPARQGSHEAVAA